MRRRDLVRISGVVALEACGGDPVTFGPITFLSPSAAVQKGVQRLPRVQIDPSRIVRTVVGLRPFRASGFRVETEKVGSKLVVHNYGHGGGGITLSWGTSQLAVDLAWASGEKKYAVLGCGAVGLATARLLQRRGASVMIYARDLPPNTTSNIAGGQWLPSSVMEEAARTVELDARLAHAARLSRKLYDELPANEYGIHKLTNYIVSDHSLVPWWEQEITPELYTDARDLTPEENPFGTAHARRFDTLLVDPSIYMGKLLDEVRAAGAQITQREIASKAELQTLPEAVILNCTGLGSKAIFEDEELEPVKGQLTILKPQPEVDYIVIDYGLYMIPRRDGVLLGGTFEHGEWSLEPDADATKRIWDGHRALFNRMS